MSFIYRSEKIPPQPRVVRRYEPYATFDRMRKLPKRSLDSFDQFFYGYSQGYLLTKEIFLAQAKYMEDFTDHYDGEAPLHALYHVTYADMNDEQLRTYFTWRTQVRAGEVRVSSFSYALCYLYEIINGIGVTDPQDGMDKLLNFWRAYHVHNDRIDHYLQTWVRDYYILYCARLPKNFIAYKKDFPAIHEDLTEQDLRQALAFRLDDLRIIELSSSYHISNGPFYRTSPEIIEKCVCYILSNLSAFLKAAGEDLHKLLIQKKHESFTALFRDAIYIQKVPILAGRQIELSKYESITKRKNDWLREYYSLTIYKSAVGYLLKSIEVNLRLYAGYKTQLKMPSLSQLQNSLIYSEMPTSTSARSRKNGNVNDWINWQLKTLHLLSSQACLQIITDSIQEYCKEHHVYAENGTLAVRKLVAIDVGRLNQIRQDHRETEERLKTDVTASIAENPISDLPLKADKSPIAARKVSSGKSPFTAFFSGLIPEEKQVIRSLLDSPDSPKDGNGWELLVESINEKSLHLIGDNLIDRDPDGFFLYEDYVPELQDYRRTT